MTGRAGRNRSKDQKAIDRYNKLLSESIAIVGRFETQLSRHKSRIGKEARKQEFERMKNTDIEIDFKVETKEIEYLKVKQKARTYNYENYMIAKLWGCFRIFKDGQELPREIADLRTTDTLTTAKKALQMIVKDEEEEVQEAV